MPQSSLFGSHTPHAFIQQPEFVNGKQFLQDFGGQNGFHDVRNMKRDARGLGAGNFENEGVPIGPTTQKRAKVSWQNENDLCENAKPEEQTTKMAAERVTDMPICNSMVTHMTTSFMADQPINNQSPNTEMEVQEDIDMDCQDGMQNEEEQKKANSIQTYDERPSINSHVDCPTCGKKIKKLFMDVY